MHVQYSAVQNEGAKVQYLFRLLRDSCELIQLAEIGP